MIILALLIITLAVFLMVRGVEVRLVLIGAGLIMATAAGRPLAIADRFAWAMVTAMVAPICASMGFAAVLSATGCDQHLVHLLMMPLRRVRWLVMPGGIGAAYLVNIAVPSQSSTAAIVGPVLVPLLIAAGAGPTAAAAALVLGASFGGDLLNPGAQDVQAVATLTGLPARALSAHIIPSSVAGLLVAALTFSLFNRPQKNSTHGNNHPKPEPLTPETPTPFSLNLVKAVIPLVPITLLVIAYAGSTSLSWLVRLPPGNEWGPLASALPVVRAMLIGVLLAAAVSWRQLPYVTRSLFDGMGVAYGKVISLTIAAQCFGTGIGVIGLGDALLARLGGLRWMLAALSIVVPWTLAVLSGSGSGPVLTFAQTFLAPLGAHPGSEVLSALTCMAAATGRTMSPVSAVVIYGSGLVGIDPLALVRRLTPALLAGAMVEMAAAIMLG